VSKSYIAIAATLAFGTSAAAFATAAPAQAPRAAAPAKPAPAAAAAPNRATVLRNLDANFKLIDTSGDGVLTQAELAAAEVRGQQQRANALRARVDAQFAKLDTNRDGQLSKAEFQAAMPAPAATAATGAGILAQLDKNKDGKVSTDEYRAPVLSRFDRADTNKDGTISAAERQAAARQTAQATRK
jgi:hypothetical protein